MLPPANYADGRGLAAALCQQDGAAAASSGAAGGADQQQGAFPAANGHSDGSNGTAWKGGRGSALFDFGAAYPGEPPAERMRRVSMSAAAWEQAQLEKQAQAAQAAGGERQQQGAGQPPSGQEQQQQQGQGAAPQQPAPTRRRSMSDALRSRPQQLALRVASSGGRGKFDASLPVEFGGRRKSGGGGSGTAAKLAPAVARGSDLDDASYYGGDGASTYGGSYHGGSYYEARCGGEFEVASWVQRSSVGEGELAPAAAYRSCSGSAERHGGARSGNASNLRLPLPKLPAHPASFPPLCPTSYHGSHYGGSRAGGSHAGSHGGSYHGGTGGAWSIAPVQLPAVEPAAVPLAPVVCSALATPQIQLCLHLQARFTATPAATTAAATMVRWHLAEHGRPAAQLPLTRLPLPRRCLACACHSLTTKRCRPPYKAHFFFPPALGGSYYEPSGKDGFGSARSREREAKPKKPATEAGGGLGAKLRRLFCFG